MGREHISHRLTHAMASSRYNAQLTEQIFDGGFFAVFFAKKVTAKICPVELFVRHLST
tara:strand:- start:441 stop:614 length:174 start_codon:yes stop_codon:yes gene_type:complete